MPPAGLAAPANQRERSFQQTGFVDPAPGFKNKLRVAVLPFDTPKNQPDVEQYGPGTMDSLIVGLRSVPSFIIVDRGRIDRVIKEQAFGQTGLVDPKTAVKAGKILGAQVLISGSIQTAGAGDNRQVVIISTVVDVETGAVKETQRVRGTLAQIFDLQEQLADAFIKSRNVVATEAQSRRVEQSIKATASLSAYDQYLKGRQAYSRYTTAGFREAIEWYRKAIATDPKYALAYAGLADAYGHLGYFREKNGQAFQAEYEQAYEASRQALALNPDLSDAHRAYAEAAGALKKIDLPQIEAGIRRALALNPGDARAWMDLWIVTRNGTNPDHEFIKRALQLDPDLASIRGDRGVRLTDQGRLKEAEAELRAGLKANPGVPFLHVNLGYALHAQKRYDEAIAEFRAALKLEPDLASAHYNLASVLDDLGRYEEAVAEFREAIRIFPGKAVAHNNLALTLLRMQRFDESLAEAREAARLDPEMWEPHHNQGLAFYILKRFPEAEAAQRESIRRNAGHASSHYELGNALFRQGRHAEAEAAYRAAARLDPRDARPRSNLGMVLNAQGRVDEAIASYREAIRIDPKYAIPRFNLAGRLARKGQLAAALAELRQALALNPALKAAARTDDDLDPLRGDPEFRKLVE